MARRIFRNPWPHEEQGIPDILRWQLGLPPREKAMMPDAPDRPAERWALDPSAMATGPAHGCRVTWLGHASFLIQTAGKNLLVDPVFSNHCAPLPFPSLRRKVEPPCRIDELPVVDCILLTHTHYDHLDLPSLRKLGMETHIIIAEGHADWLKREGFQQVTELPWWESQMIDSNIRITATPAQHFTARTAWDRNHGHWCGWGIEAVDCLVWHAGDSGYCPAFREIGERLGPIDFGMIPIGAYQPRRIMKSLHMNPEEAVQALIDARCRRSVAMHWGTFRLTDEPMGEPPIRFRDAVVSRNLDPTQHVAGAVGQSWLVSPAGGLDQSIRSASRIRS